MADRTLDLVAASRVARRVNLTDVYVVEATAKRHRSHSDSALKPDLNDSYKCTRRTDNKLEILCRHHLKAASGADPIAEIQIDLNLIYEIAGTDSLDETDLSAFADANGAYNSWPFIREFLNSLTLRLGLPAFVLPTLRMVPAPKIQVQTPSVQTPPPEPDVKDNEPKG